MNTEMILVGIILFSGMTAGAVKIWLNKRKERIILKKIKENGLEEKFGKIMEKVNMKH